MSQSHAQIYLHLVFSTKERRPFLRDHDLRNRLHEYVGGACRDLGCPSIRVGGFDDHIHVACRFGRTITIADLIRELKRESSKWIKDKGRGVAHFQWQAGYGAFSVSPSHVARLKEYIENQETHHAKESFQDEFRRLLKLYGIEWDERYVWD